MRRAVLLRSEQSSEQRPRSEDLEEVAGDLRLPELHRAVAIRERETGGAIVGERCDVA